MQIEFGLANISPEWKESVVCIGTFDGVHRGHREVISRAVKSARGEGLPCCLVTFDRHPGATLNPSTCPPGISSLSSRLRKFEALGVDVVVVLPFDLELSRLEASEFLKTILVDTLKAKKAVVGHDFRMGKGRSGDAIWLGGQIPTEVVPPFEIEGRRVSSSLVRNAVLTGELEEAALLLGEPFEIEGVVVSGDRLGRTLGYPTANVARGFVQVLPPDGVFRGTLALGETRYMSAISIGTRPSVQGTDLRIEAYLLNYQGVDFYGQACTLQILEMLRGQEKFDNLDELKLQISKDVETVRAGSTKGLPSPSLRQ